MRIERFINSISSTTQRRNSTSCSRRPLGSYIAPPNYLPAICLFRPDFKVQGTMEGAINRAGLRLLKSSMGMGGSPLRAMRPVHQRFVRNIGSSAPTIAQPSFWKSLVPKPLRRRKEPAVDWGVPNKPRSKEWNPATFFIFMFLFIGSMSIQMIALRRDFTTFTRRAETRIGILREVIEKLQKGEDVDVEKALGTGDAEREKEWEEGSLHQHCLTQLRYSC